MEHLKKLIDLLTAKLESSNTNGIPFPVLRDPQTGKGSVTLTMWFITFNIAIITLIGRVVKLLNGVDYDSVLWLFGITGGFYLGRKIQKKSDGSLEVGDKAE
jgi:hypothetical protein